MREIKFRIAEFDDEGKFSDLFYLDCAKQPFDSRWLDYNDTMNEINEYTGLKDKNGKEIYEGDILNRYGDNYNGVVEWGDYSEGPGFQIHEYYPKKEHDRIHTMESYTTPKEVIGNIYETPELKNKWGNL